MQPNIEFKRVRRAGLAEEAPPPKRRRRTQVAQTDLPAVRDTLVALRAETEAAEAETSGPLWAIAGHLTFVAADMRAVRVVDPLALRMNMSPGREWVKRVRSTSSTDSASDIRNRVISGSMTAIGCK